MDDTSEEAHLTKRSQREAVRALLSPKDRAGLRAQAFLARIFLPVLYPIYLVLLRFALGYRVRGHRQTVARIRSELAHRREPLLICPNHLTMIDSIILLWILTPWWRTFWDLRLFAWNTPEKRNFAHVPVLRFFAYIGRCIEIIRQAPREETQKLLAKLKALLVHGQSVMIFPEGKRSRSGRVDTEDFAYGVGKIIDDLRLIGASPRVLCIYLRGRRQSGHSVIPKRGESFYLDYALLDPQTEYRGLRAHRDLSTRIVQTLAELEGNYFASSDISR